MRDEDKIKEQLFKELVSARESLRQCSVALQARNQDLDDVARYVVSEFRSPMGTIVGYAELLEEYGAVLSHEDLGHCIRTIKQNGRKLSQMVNVLLLLANSHRLFDNVWHAAYLATMEETALSQWAREEHAPEVYRFTCLPASSAPLVMRVWTTGGETPRFQAIAKLGNGPGSDEGEASPTSQEVQWTLEAEEWDSLLITVEGNRFWTDAPTLEQLGWLEMVGAGGEEWIFEGWRSDQYKARAIWNPDDEKGRAAYALGRSFINLLPGWFALEMARFWAKGSWPGFDRRFREEMGSVPFDEEII